MTKRHLLALLLLAPTAGCYTYVATPLDALPKGSHVRVEVTRETAARLSDALAADRTSVEGQVQGLEGGDLLLDVVVASHQVSFLYQPLHQTIRLAPADATFVQRKLLDRGRTAVAVGVAGVAAGAIAWKALSGKVGGSEKPPGTGGPADARRVPLLIRIPFP
jgi:hypothetical protein